MVKLSKCRHEKTKIIHTEKNGLKLTKIVCKKCGKVIDCSG